MRPWHGLGTTWIISLARVCKKILIFCLIYIKKKNMLREEESWTNNNKICWEIMIIFSCVQYYDWQWKFHLASPLFLLFDENSFCGFWHNFRQFLSLSLGSHSTSNRAVCAHASIFRYVVFSHVSGWSRNIRCKLRSDIFIIFRSREWWWWCRSKNEAERRIIWRKKVQWNFVRCTRFSQKKMKKSILKFQSGPDKM